MNAKIKDKVRSILELVPSTRDNDSELISIFWEQELGHEMINLSAESFLRSALSYALCADAYPSANETPSLLGKRAQLIVELISFLRTHNPGFRVKSSSPA